MHIHTCKISTYIETHVYTCTYVHTHVRMFVHMYVCSYTQTYTVYTYVTFTRCSQMKAKVFNSFTGNRVILRCNPGHISVSYLQTTFPCNAETLISHYMWIAVIGFTHGRANEYNYNFSIGSFITMTCIMN